MIPSMDEMSRRAIRLIAFPALFALLGAVGCGDSGGQGGSDTWRYPGDTAGADGAEPGPDGRGGPDAGDVEPGDTTGQQPGQVSTSEGPVAGTRSGENDEIWEFLGIPYAKPPTGKLRWRAPREPEPRDDLFEADSWGFACPQPGSSTSNPGPTDEDCLTLNVWTPGLESDEKRPVMVWFHGGGFIQGSSAVSYPGGTRLYAGRRFAERDVVVVTVNYRLGPLGFFAHPDLIGEDDEYSAAGNYGFLDQVAALEWVQKNIENFGGDPDQVTIFGESAGGISVCGHLAAQHSRGLFDRAIMQSGNCPAFLRRLNQQERGMVSAVEQGKRIAKKVGCEGKGIQCLRSKTTEEIFNHLNVTIQSGNGGEQFGLVVDGEVFDKQVWNSMQAGEVADVPLVAGTNADEGTLFAQSYQGYSEQDYRDWVENTFSARSEGVLNQYPAADYSEPWKAIAAILGDILFTCPTRWALQAHVANGHRAWGYLFSHVTPYGSRNDLGAFHGSEITFVFNNFIRQSIPQEEMDLSDQMQTYWTQYAKQGDPGTAAGHEWSHYSLVDDEILDLKTPDAGTRTEYRKEYCDFWAP